MKAEGLVLLLEPAVSVTKLTVHFLGVKGSLCSTKTVIPHEQKERMSDIATAFYICLFFVDCLWLFNNTVSSSDREQCTGNGKEGSGRDVI
jgi:hypothetical protein